jgi:hypothetical protein
MGGTIMRILTPEPSERTTKTLPSCGDFGRRGT